MDEHYYMSPDWFLKNAGRYDTYDRKGPKIFAGEFAAHGPDGATSESKNTWLSALTEAAFMTGLERNADIVQMACYAPLLAHADAWQWRPDLIWFDNLKAMATPNYWVQKMFSTFKGTDVVSMLSAGKTIIGKDSLYANAVVDVAKKQLIVKIVNASGKETRQTLVINSREELNKKAVLHVLQHDRLLDINSLQEPGAIMPAESIIAVRGKRLILDIPKYSFSILVLDMKK